MRPPARTHMHARTSRYAAEKASALESDGNLAEIRAAYEQNVQAAREAALQAKHEQVRKLQSRLIQRRQQSARKALNALDAEFSKVQQQLGESAAKRVEEKCASLEAQMNEELRVAAAQAAKANDPKAGERAAQRIRERFATRRAHVVADLERQVGRWLGGFCCLAGNVAWRGVATWQRGNVPFRAVALGRVFTHAHRWPPVPRNTRNTCVCPRLSV